MVWLLIWLICQWQSVEAFSASPRGLAQRNPTRLFQQQQQVAADKPETKRAKRRQQLRQEGGWFSFNTKYGALNPFAIYYGLVAILLGLPWFVALTAYQVLRALTGGRLDKRRKIPVLMNHLWGTLLMRLTRSFPVMENKHILEEFYKQQRPCMFVANHNSWMDIPFLGATIGWRNYKIISKAELGRVPILGKAIRVGGNIMVDRSNKRSQLKTLKQGINYLKDGIILCTFPEGTRSRSGKLRPFKNGAFKMAHKAGAPVIPLSLVDTAQAMPVHWMFSCRPARNVGAKVSIHPAVESKGISEQELADRVRKAMISGLPEDQRPVNE